MATREDKDTTFQLTDLPEELGSRGREVWLAGLGALATVGDEGAKFYNSLVERGSQVEQEGKSQLGMTASELDERRQAAMQEVQERTNEARGTVSKALGEALERFGVPTRQEVNRLSGKVDALAEKVEALTAALEKRGAAGRTTTDTTIYHVVAQGEKGWTVEKDGDEHATSVHETKEEARDRGRELAQKHEPSRLIVHKQDGSVQETFSYGLDE